MYVDLDWVILDIDSIVALQREGSKDQTVHLSNGSRFKLGYIDFDIVSNLLKKNNAVLKWEDIRKLEEEVREPIKFLDIKLPD